LAKGQTEKTLFTLDGKQYTGRDFAYFSQDNPKGIKARLNDFIRKSVYDNENNILESKYPEFRFLLQQSDDEELLSLINEQLLNKASNEKDLEDYFTAHKKDFNWELPRYKGIVIHAKDKKTTKKIKKQLRKIPENQRMDFLQRTYNAQTPGTIQAQEGTFAVAQNEFVDKMIFKVGKYVPLQSHPYTVIVGRKVKGPESYTEIRDILVKDYHKYIEERWVSQLRKKSKVEINQEVLKTVNNH